LFKSPDVYYRNPDDGDESVSEMLVDWTTWHSCLLKRFVCSSFTVRALRRTSFYLCSGVSNQIFCTYTLCVISQTSFGFVCHFLWLTWQECN